MTILPGFARASARTVSKNSSPSSESVRTPLRRNIVAWERGSTARSTSSFCQVAMGASGPSAVHALDGGLLALVLGDHREQVHDLEHRARLPLELGEGDAVAGVDGGGVAGGQDPDTGARDHVDVREVDHDAGRFLAQRLTHALEKGEAVLRAGESALETEDAGAGLRVDVPIHFELMPGHGRLRGSVHAPTAP